MFSRKSRPKTAYLRKPNCTEKNVQIEKTVKIKRESQSAPINSRKKPYKTIIKAREFDRIRNATVRIPTLEERCVELQKNEKDKEILARESDQRKQLFKQLDEHSHFKTLTNIMEENQLSQKLKLLDKAFLAKQEQEDEVKQANRIIMNAKCNIIRYAQVQEKQELIEKLREEERRLDEVMLDSAKVSLMKDDATIGKDKEKRLDYAKEIQNQIRERDVVKHRELLMKEDEAYSIAQTQELLKNEEDKRKKDILENKLKLISDMNNLKKTSELVRMQKEEDMKKDEERQKYFLKQKEEFNRKVIEDRKLRQYLFSKKQDHIFQLGTIRLQSKVGMDEMQFIRNRESLEREYRQKEKETALKRKIIEDEILAARQQQIKELKEKKAVQVMKNAEDFYKTVEMLKIEEARQKEKEKMNLENREKYKQEIMEQVRNRENERREMELQLKKEFLARKAKEEEREANIRSVIQSKLNTMRDANLPEKYIREVEKQLKKIVISDCKKL